MQTSWTAHGFFLDSHVYISIVFAGKSKFLSSCMYSKRNQGYFSGEFDRHTHYWFNSLKKEIGK